MSSNAVDATQKLHPTHGRKMLRAKKAVNCVRSLVYYIKHCNRECFVCKQPTKCMTIRRSHLFAHIRIGEMPTTFFSLTPSLSLSRYFSLKRTKFCENAKGIKFYHRNWVALRFDVAYWITKRIRGIRMFSTSYQNYISKSTNTTNLPSNLFARIETFWSHGLD